MANAKEKTKTVTPGKKSSPAKAKTKAPSAKKSYLVIVESPAKAKTIQKYFLDILKTDGEAVTEGDEDTDCVYLYKKSTRTTP